MAASDVVPSPPLASPHDLRRDPVLVALAVSAVGTIVGYGLGLGSLTAQVALCWTLLAVLHVGLAATAARIARRSVASTPGRRVWGAIAMAGVAYAIGDVVQLVLVATRPLTLPVILGGPVQTLMVLVGTALPIGVAVLLTPSIGYGSRRSRARLWIDVSIVMVAATTFGAFAYVPVEGAGLLTTALGLVVGPGIFLVGVLGVVKLVFSARPPFSLLAGQTLGAAAGLEGMVQAGTSLLVAQGRVSWLLGLTLVSSGLLLTSARIQCLQVRAATDVVRTRSRRRFSLMPYAALGATYLLLVWVLLQEDLTGAEWAVVGGAVLSTGLVVGRQLIAFTDNTRLVDRLDTTVDELRTLLAERDRLATRLRYEALHDPLTGLANRALLDERLREAISRLGSGAGHLSLMIVDLNEFKQVNDRFGHAAGDTLLVETARRLGVCVRDRDVVARLGGDEFAVLLEDLPHGAVEVAWRIVEAVAEPVVVGDGDEVRVSASLGVVSTADAGRTAEELLHGADTAMYEAKRSDGVGHRLCAVTLEPAVEAADGDREDRDLEDDDLEDDEESAAS